jgi:hypothetical protein
VMIRHGIMYVYIYTYVCRDKFNPTVHYFNLIEIDTAVAERSGSKLKDIQKGE